ncbi:MAG: exonuclease domain-containing protein [bacterium]|nr:exonuclease domain-containing protein [bacterium]
MADLTSNRVVLGYETTGFGGDGHLLEIACVSISPEGQVLEEWDTLVNPENDPGPERLHGITPSLLEGAPAFSAVSGDVAARLDGAVPVAHNLSVCMGVLVREFDRLGAYVDPGSGVCTFELCGTSLSAAAQTHGIAAGSDRGALQHARIAAELYRRLAEDAGPVEPAYVALSIGIGPPGAPTKRRGTDTVRSGGLWTIGDQVSWPREHQDESAVYLDCLDRMLDDLEIGNAEQRFLDEAARDLGISLAERQRLHAAYTQSVKDMIVADRVVTQAQRDRLAAVAQALGCEIDLPDITDPAPPN